MASFNTRFAKEYKILQSSDLEGILCTPKHDSLNQYEARIDGPGETPYENGRFLVDITLTDQYPIEPPSVKFRTRIYHPNIDDHGNICLDILKTGTKGTWKPQWTLVSVLLALTVLMRAPNPDDPLMPDIAEELKSDTEAYQRKAREWTARFAKPVKGDRDEDETGPLHASQTPEGAAKPVPKMRSLGLKRKPASPAPANTQAGATRPDGSGGQFEKPPPGAPAASVSATSSSVSRRLGLSRSRNAPPAKSRAQQQQSPGLGRVSLASSQEEPGSLRRGSSSQSSALSSPAASSRKASGGAKLSDLLGKTSLSKIHNTRRNLPPFHGSQALATSDGRSSKDKGGAEETLPVGDGSSNGKRKRLRVLEPESDESSQPAAQFLAEESDIDSEELLGVEGTNSTNLDFECLLSPGEDTTSFSVSIAPSSRDDSEQGPPVPPVPIASSDAAGTVSQGEATSQPALPAGQDRKGKGKAPDHWPQQQQQQQQQRNTEAVEVLNESHFGPLDLGLPPIHVSAQRKLMRRRHRQ
ncbi:hypothetical protein EC988_002366 [Linderina pennispora]|nr:hypothetical protein EC988_002366 [Linderina pennispora]